MALLVLLMPADQDGLSVSARNVEALSRLGVTRVSLSRDERTSVVILEGWALDPAHHEEVVAALDASAAGVRVLQPIVQMAVSAASSQGVSLK